MIQVNFRKNLIDLLHEKEICQTQLAREVHISQSAISNWLSGKKEPSIESLWILADYFNVTIDQLVGREKLFD
ncbi:MAG: helix-turn-helix domain-containing protein [Clostridia bacterium]|nr:helix-turn-helix domain-containing protein [Clostridia bacterium]